MTNRDGPVARAIRVANDDVRRVTADLARARRGAGLSRDVVGRAAGMTRSSLERLENGARSASVRELACVGAVVGVDVRLHAYPAGDPIRDAGQLRLLRRLRARLHPSLGWRTEVPLPIDGDRRAWDAVISGSGWRIGVEAETVVDDLQALERRLNLKRRDGRVDDVILLIADTRRNRRALATRDEAFGDLAGVPRTTLLALAAGRRPSAGAVIQL